MPERMVPLNIQEGEGWAMGMVVPEMNAPGSATPPPDLVEARSTCHLLEKTLATTEGRGDVSTCAAMANSRLDKSKMSGSRMT